ncbi:uncharacterized protein LOC110707519 [Chenopodium quinoa]|uniref:uncharacterized protein LOC110707519 n=1 Tax=Chenopodium quinoa TaxID=63459 RepID=UPI000B76CE9E|nr:uncharacterized protein LOC110707519 [Chenopodium quinoa]
MDLEEWDLLSDEGLIDFHENNGANNFVPKSSTTVIDMNYFQKFTEPEMKKMKNSRVIPVPIQLDKKIEEIPEEVIKLPIDETPKKSDENQMIKGEEADFQEPVSQVFFKKLKENEFVDMKMDSPKSLNRGILPQIDVGSYQFEEIERNKSNNFEKIEEKEHELSMKKEENDHENGNEEGLNVWKLAMTGIGALFSFGFAAATVSFIVLGNRHKETSKKQELHFQLYAHDKRFKQVVRQATKLNEAITVMRGAPVTRAHITIGGYHEGL